MAKNGAPAGMIVLLLLAVIAASSLGGQGLPQGETTLKTAPPPAPVITAWGPKDKVATGEILWFQGTNLKSDLFVVTLGDRTIMPHLFFELLPASTSTASRIEVRTSSAMKTGVQTSTPLKVLHRGGPAVTLDADYHVVDRRAKFSGISKFYAGPSNTYSVFTEGTVQIDLDDLEFANEGSGIYREQVRLIREVKKTTEPCPAPMTLLNRTTTYYDWTAVNIQRSITWKRDPAVRTRVMLNGVGLEQRINATGDLMPDGGLQCGFIGYYGKSKPYQSESGCEEPIGGPNEQLAPAQTPPPLVPASPTYVTYSLRRAI